MIIFDATKELNKDVSTKIAIGKFDGIHLGHRKLISEMVSSKDSLKSVVFTFSIDSPLSFNKDGYIYSEEKRRSIFESLGVDYLAEYYLTKESAGISPEDFVRKILKDKLHVKAVYCGKDLSFGYKGMGNVDTLKALSKELDIEVHVVEKEKYQNEDISSTRIREALKAGKEEDAKLMLGDLKNYM